MIPERRGFAAIFLGLLTLFPTGCARNPVTGDRQLVLISERQEIAYGREAHPEILAEFGSVPNEQLQSYLDQVGQKLARISHRPELEWHFTVVDVPVINAFALPGGYIYFTREILAYMNNEAELAGVLGHETGHVTARHSVTQMSRAQLLGLGLGLGSVFSPTFYELSEAAQLGLGLLFLRYSRDHERQSDELGVEYMSRAGYDPRELSDFFVVFQRLREKEDQAIPSWFSSHPEPPERIEKTAQLAKEALQRQPDRQWQIGREAFLNQINGIVFGENPREGFVEEGWFLHPDLKFRIRFPEGWRINNSKRSVVAAPQSREAALRLQLAQAPAGTSPEQYARELSRQPGTRFLDGRNTRINGHPAFLGVYEVSDPSGNRLGLLAAFISFQGRLYEMVGMTPAQLFRQYNGIFERSLTSFSELTDSRALSVQPDRLQVRKVKRGETLRAIAQQIANPRVTVEDLGLLNRVNPEDSLPAGTLIKVIEPGRQGVN